MTFLTLSTLFLSALIWLLFKAVRGLDQRLKETGNRLTRTDADVIVLSSRVKALEAAEDAAEAYESF